MCPEAGLRCDNFSTFAFNRFADIEGSCSSLLENVPIVLFFLLGFLLPSYRFGEQVIQKSHFPLVMKSECDGCGATQLVLCWVPGWCSLCQA